jgi:peroxiredoxin Q/BCP
MATKSKDSVRTRAKSKLAASARGAKATKPSKGAPKAKAASSRDGALRVGAKAPAFSLADASGARVSLGDFAGKWLVLYFYPKDDTPGCTIEACELTNEMDAFEDLGAAVVGVSPDSPAQHVKFIDKYKLRVRLLSDPDKKVLSAYGAWGMKKMYGRDVEGVIRSTVIIDPAGKVAHLYPNVKAAGHAAAVRDRLTQLRG